MDQSGFDLESVPHLFVVAAKNRLSANKSLLRVSSMELHLSFNQHYSHGNMIAFLIAGGSIISTFTAPQLPEMMNHTLSGTPVKAPEVVCRSRWGTPMMPDGMGSYKLTAPPNAAYIERSLIQPPNTEAPIFRPGEPYIVRPQATVAEPQPVLPN